MHFYSTDLSEPDEGVRQGAPHHRGEAHVMSNHHLIHGLYFKPAAVAVTVSSVDTLKVPALQGPYEEYRVSMIIESYETIRILTSVQSALFAILMFNYLFKI